LGNPGARYVGTRHNFGFEAVDHLAEEAGAGWSRAATGSHCLVAEGRLEGRSVVFAKPQDFMNRSGWAVAELMRVHNAGLAETMVFFDDIALPLGTLRIRERGGDGGHRGLASVLEVVGGEEIARVRLGIRPDFEPEDLSEFVLAPFTSDERRVVEEVLNRAVAATRTVLVDGMSKAMSLHNQTVTDSERERN
jgi:PTH1 family peptidyl-tRNA hydrolase